MKENIVLVRLGGHELALTDDPGGGDAKGVSGSEVMKEAIGCYKHLFKGGLSVTHGSLRTVLLNSVGGRL